MICRYKNNTILLVSPYLFSNALGSTTTTTTKLVIINANVINVTNAILPLLAGNFPLMIQCCDSKYLWNPTPNITILIARKVAPSGLPSCRRCRYGSEPLPAAEVVLRRKSCVMAMPMDANAREVRSQARNVRSGEASG